MSASVVMLGSGAAMGSAVSSVGDGSTTCAMGVGTIGGGGFAGTGLQIHGVGGTPARRSGAIRRTTILLGFDVLEEALRPVGVGKVLVIVVDMAGAVIWWSCG